MKVNDQTDPAPSSSTINTTQTNEAAARQLYYDKTMRSRRTWKVLAYIIGILTVAVVITFCVAFAYYGADTIRFFMGILTLMLLYLSPLLLLGVITSVVLFVIVRKLKCKADDSAVSKAIVPDLSTPSNLQAKAKNNRYIIYASIIVVGIFTLLKMLEVI